MAEETVSRRLWLAIRDVSAFAASRTGPDQPLWRLSTTPVRGHEAAARIAGDSGAEVLYDWAGGLVWISIPRVDDAGISRARAVMRTVGGHATLFRAPASLRAAAEVFDPLDGALAALTKRVKESFDPKGLLNPGRMWAGV